AQGCIMEFELSVLSFSISFKVSTHIGSATGTEEHVVLALSVSSRLCFNTGVFEALGEAFLGCVVACTAWLGKRRLLRSSLWGLLIGNSTLVSLARSVFFFSTFTEGDNCLGEATCKCELTVD
ncbi:hypothetical protein N310_02437, partial [Acanthisitta chloris]